MSAPTNTTMDPSNNTDVPQTYTAVSVDLRAAIDASAAVSVFGPSQETLSNVIWCNNKLDVSALYVNSETALFEFWEPSDARNTIAGAIATGRGAQAVAQHFSTSLHSVLQGLLDASAANPFQAYPAAYQSYTTFGELALSYAAEGLFGHPSATAAITNDTDIVTGFNNSASVNTAVTGAVTPAMADQALAQRLASSLFISGGDNVIPTAIVRSVLGQDAVRMTNDDNSILQTNVKAALRFVPGDVVYVAITLKDFNPTIGGNSPGLQAYTEVQMSQPDIQKYYLRIELA